MMRALRISLLVAIGAVLPMLMAPTGGIPSRPTFQSIGVGTPAQTNTQKIAIAGTGPFIGLTDMSQASGSRATFYQVQSGAPGIGICNDAFSICKNFMSGTRSAGSLSSIDIGNVTDNPIVRVNGSQVCTAAGGTSCPQETFTIDVNPSSSPSIIQCAHCGFGPSITRNSTGSFTIVHNVGFSGYKCSASARNVGGVMFGVAFGAGPSSNDLNIYTFNASGVLTDATTQAVMIVCAL